MGIFSLLGTPIIKDNIGKILSNSFSQENASKISFSQWVLREIKVDEVEGGERNVKLPKGLCRQFLVF